MLLIHSASLFWGKSAGFHLIWWVGQEDPCHVTVLTFWKSLLGDYILFTIHTCDVIQCWVIKKFIYAISFSIDNNIHHLFLFVPIHHNLIFNDHLSSLAVIRAPEMDTLKVPLSRSCEVIDGVSVWEWSGSALDEGAEASEWFSKYIGKPSRLVRFNTGRTSLLSDWSE